MREIESDREGEVILESRPIVKGKEENRENREKKQSTQSKYWCFVFNNYEEKDTDILESILKPECEWYIFQEETGKEGTRHLQGTIFLKKTQRLTALKKINPTIHWEKTKSVKASVEYCSKYETRTGKIYAHGIAIPEQIIVDEPYGWQLEVMDIIKDPPKHDDRTIHWFWDEDGGKGKSTFVKYLVVKHNALVVSGKTNDMFHAVAQNPSKRKLIVMDFPRSSADYINYGAIEQIKNGCFLSGKYEGGLIVYNRPHVICFANHKPVVNKTTMSEDKFRVQNIDELIWNLKIDEEGKSKD